MQVTYAIKWDEKILVTENNKNSLQWYKFIQEEISEREKDIQNLKELTKKSIDNLAKYDAIDRMYEVSELKTHELALLENKWKELLEEITIAKTNAIEKYGIEVLEELL